MKTKTAGSWHGHTVSRRTFIGTTAASGAALVAGGVGSLLQPSAALAAKASAAFLEKTIPELQAMLASGQLTSRELVLGFKVKPRVR